MEVYEINPESLKAGVGESFVIMNPETLTYYEATGVATRILELLEITPSSEKTICEALLSEFDVSEEHCSTEVQVFFRDALRSGIIRVSV
jgi:hypothetical protein